MECIDFERRYKQAALDICHESQQRCRCVKCSAFEVEEIFQIETELVIHPKDTLACRTMVIISNASRTTCPMIFSVKSFQIVSAII